MAEVPRGAQGWGRSKQLRDNFGQALAAVLGTVPTPVDGTIRMTLHTGEPIRAAVGTPEDMATAYLTAVDSWRAEGSPLREAPPIEWSTGEWARSVCWHGPDDVL